MPLRRRACDFCRVEFTPRKVTTRFCSRSCLSRNTWATKREFMLDRTMGAMALGRQSDEYRTKMEAWQHDPRNPIYQPEVKTRSVNTRRRNGFAHLNGGNGTGLTEPQELLAEALGWETEFSLAIGDGERPYMYLLDIADPETRTNVEVDGESHHWVQVARSDERRRRRLATVGWAVLRFKNEEVLTDLSGVVDRVRSSTSPQGVTTTSPGAC